MYEPRGHGAMSGAILQPPTRPDADWGVLFIEVSGCLPMCGHGTMGVATVLVETGMVTVTEPVTDDPAGHSRRAGRRRGAGRRRARRVGDAAQRRLLRLRAGRAASTCPGTGRCPYDVAFGGNFYAIIELADLGIAFEPATRAQAADARRRPGDHGRRQRPDRAASTRAAGDRRLPPRLPHRARARRRRSPGTRWRSTRAGSTARRAAPAPRPAWPSCTPAASWACTPTSSTSRSSAAGSSAGSSTRRPSAGGRPSCRPSPAGRG